MTLRQTGTRHGRFRSPVQPDSHGVKRRVSEETCPRPVESSRLPVGSIRPRDIGETTVTGLDGWTSRSPRDQYDGRTDGRVGYQSIWVVS